MFAFCLLFFSFLAFKSTAFDECARETERGNKLSITRFRGFLSDRQCKQSIPFYILIQNYRTLCSSSAPPTTNNLNDCSLWAQTFSILQVCVCGCESSNFIYLSSSWTSSPWSYHFLHDVIFEKFELKSSRDIDIGNRSHNLVIHSPSSSSSPMPLKLLRRTEQFNSWKCLHSPFGQFHSHRCHCLSSVTTAMHRGVCVWQTMPHATETWAGNDTTAKKIWQKICEIFQRFKIFITER